MTKWLSEYVVTLLEQRDSSASSSDSSGFVSDENATIPDMSDNAMTDTNATRLQHDDTSPGSWNHTIPVLVVGGAALVVTGIAVFVYLRRRSDRRETNLQNAAAHQLSLICSNDSNKETNESRKPRDNPLIEKEDRFGNRRSINDFLEMLSSSPSAWESSPLSLSLAQTAESLASGSPNGAKLTDSSVLYALANDPHLKNAQIPFELLQFHHLIARSSRSEVWLCVLRDRCVAVKRLHKEKRRDLEETKAFVKAIRLSAPLQHPSILDFVGVTWNSLRNLCLITEYLELGDLSEQVREALAPLAAVDYVGHGA
ncbi:hypothetical protein KRP22_013065 [Phytophthora ramorum]|nr:hypothetical protein KRP22_8503 [Phytophthora ramorum]